MRKPIEITQIDLLVHPGFLHPQGDNWLSDPAQYTPEYWDLLIKLYQQRIEEIARNPNRVMVIVPSFATNNETLSGERWKKSLRSQTVVGEPGKAVQELMQYAKQKLKKRLIIYADELATGWPENPLSLLARRGFRLDPETVQIEAYGEYAHGCVREELNELCKLLKINPYIEGQVRIRLDLSGNYPEKILAILARQKFLARLHKKPRLRERIRAKIRRKGILKRHPIRARPK